MADGLDGAGWVLYESVDMYWASGPLHNASGPPLNPEKGADGL